MSKRTAILDQTEAQLHYAVAGFLRIALAPPAIFTSFPAGGGGEMRGRILKGMGLRSGFPDLIIIAPPSGTLYGLELKTATGRLSDAQRRCHIDIEAAGGHVATCRSLEEVKAQLKEWGLPLRRVSLANERFGDAVRRAVSPAAASSAPGGYAPWTR